MQSQAHRFHALDPQFSHAARALVGRKSTAQQQWRAVGPFAPAITVAVDEAKHVEQGLGARQVATAQFAAQRGVKTVTMRCQHAVRRFIGVAEGIAVFQGVVVGQADGAAQCHLLWRVAAHRDVVKVEEGHARAGRQVTSGVNTAFNQERRQLAVGHRHRREFTGQVHQVNLVAQEGQPARLRFVDDGNFNAVQQGQVLTCVVFSKRHQLGVFSWRMSAVKLLAKARVALEHDARSTAPLHQPKRPRAHGVGHQFIAIPFNHFTSHGTGQAGLRKEEGQAWRRRCQAHFKAVAIECAQARHGCVVIEG